MPQNYVEKIAQKFAVGLKLGETVNAGDFISVKPSYVMTHDNTGAVIPKFKSIGATKFAFPNQVVNTLDHNIQDTSEKNLEKYRKIEEFSKSHGADFYPAGRGIGHQIMVEEGYIIPGTLVVASDSHSNMYGGLGCLGTPIVRTDAASIWATGRTWWQVPPISKVILNGKLQKGVRGKDVIIALCGYFNNDEVLNHIVEFSGSGIAELEIDQRLTIANMTTEWGTLGGVFPADEKTLQWLEQRADFLEKRGLAGVNSDSLGNGKNPRLNKEVILKLRDELSMLIPDEDAIYSKILEIDLSTIEPYISGPNTVKVMKPISEIKKDKIKINKAYLVSCVNSRLDDIKEAAEALKNNDKVAEGVDFYIAAASNEVQTLAEEFGYWQKLVEAGAKVLPPGCGPCIGLGTGLLEDGEVGISATNRNFKGRMGSASAQAYLASPAVVVKSAVSGFIDYNFNGLSTNIFGGIKTNPAPKKFVNNVEIVHGFPSVIEGRIIYCYQNNMNTDGIYPGKYTYNDDFTPNEQAKVAMENYDPEFQKIVKNGDILVGGYNFGTGSSREQAATALKYRGIQLVIVGSASATYVRNALNNGFLILQIPEIYEYLNEKFGTSKLTVNTEKSAIVDFKQSKIKFDDVEFSFNPLGNAAQELIVVDGLENWIKENIQK